MELNCPWLAPHIRRSGLIVLLTHGLIVGMRIGLTCYRIGVGRSYLSTRTLVSILHNECITIVEQPFIAPTLV